VPLDRGYLNNAGIRAVAEANLRDAREAGFVTAGYINTSPWHSAGEALTQGQFNAGAEWEHLAFVPNDVEIDGVGEADVLALCEAIEAAGKKTCIYSAAWFWIGHLGNAQWPWLRRYGLWEAYYDGDPDIDFANRRFGPWELSDVIGEQYQNDVTIEGVTTDLNVFRGSFLQEDDMADLSDADKQWITDKLVLVRDNGLRYSGLFDPADPTSTISVAQQLEDMEKRLNARITAIQTGESGAHHVEVKVVD